MHRIDGPGATVDNRFTDGDPVGGVQATMVTDDWANDVQEELMSILTAAGVAPVKGTQNQVLSALTTLIRGQGFSAYTTAGTSPAFTITPSPAIDAYTTSQRFSVKFNAAAPGGGTLDVSGKGPKNLKQYDSTGAKIATVIAANQVTDVVYDGTDFVVLDPLPAAFVQQVGIQGSAKNLIVSATGLSSIITISAEELTAKNAAGQALLMSNVFLSVNLAVSGLNGLDTGTVAASSLYSVWAISNGTTKGAVAALCPVLTGNTTAGSGVVTALSSTASMRVGMPFAGGSFPPGAVILSVDSSTQITASLPATATATGASLRFVYDPVMPSGYTYKARASAIPTDGTANKYPLGFTQAGRIVQPKVAAGSNLASLQLMASGNVAYPTAVAVGSFVPPTATRICVVPVLTNATNIITVAPNASYGPALSTTNPPPMQELSNTGGGSFNTPKWMNLESTNIYWGTNGASNYLFLFGWEDNL